MLLHLLGLLACSGEPEPASLRPVQQSQDCEAYPEDTRGYCLAQRVKQQPSLGVGLCEEAGPWETECRRGWVRVSLGGKELPREALLEACDADEECLFDVLEERAEADLLAQLGLCRGHLSETAPFCEQHAANRWLASQPDEVERLRIAAGSGSTEARGKALGHLAACSSEGRCEDYPEELHSACRGLAEQVAATRTLCDPAPLR